MTDVGNRSRKRSAEEIADGSDEPSRIEFLYTGQDKSDIPRDITHARINPGVTKIKAEAFKGCKHLLEIELCEGVEVIEESAFRGCASLKSFSTPSSIKVIEKSAFSFCNRLAEVNFACGLKRIDNGAFNRCRKLTRIRMPETLRCIGPDAFHCCTKLEDVVLNTGLLRIHKAAFRECNSLKSLAIPPSVKNMGELVFIHCKGLKTLEFQEGMEEIGRNLCSFCKNLESVTLPSTLRKLGNGLFSHCYQLKEIQIGEGVERLGATTFNYCGSLQRVVVPSSMKVIGGSAFDNCVQLMSVEIFSKNDFAVEKWSFDRGEDSFPAAKRTIFENCWSLRNVAIPQSKGLQVFDEGCHDLMKLFGTREGIMDALTKRFNGLRIHELVYNQSYDGGLGEIEDILRKDSSNDRTEQDCLGMTPLHIFACCTKQNLGLLKALVRKMPKSLVTKDKWGCIPLQYAIWAGAPSDTLQYLIESQISHFPDFAPDWDRMLETLCRAGVSLNVLQRLFHTHDLALLREQSIDWRKASRELTVCCLMRMFNMSGYSQSVKPDEIWRREMGPFFDSWYTMLDAFASYPVAQCLHEIKDQFFTVMPRKKVTAEEAIAKKQALAMFDISSSEEEEDGLIHSAQWQEMCEELVGPLRGWWDPKRPRESLGAFHFLMKCDISNRLISLEVSKWQRELRDLISQVQTREQFNGNWLWDRNSRYHTIHSKLVFYEQKFATLKDATSLLELALWKTKICESNAVGAEERALCRAGCGAGVIIPAVLPHLMDEEEPRDDVSTDCDSSADY